MDVTVHWIPVFRQCHLLINSFINLFHPLFIQRILNPGEKVNYQEIFASENTVMHSICYFRDLQVIFQVLMAGILMELLKNLST